MKQWYLQQTQRDQHIVISLAVSIAAVAIYVLLIQPFTSSLENRRATVTAKIELLLWMQESAAQLQRVRGSVGTGKRSDKAAYVLLDDSIRKAGLSAAADRVEPAGKNKKGARMQFSQVDFDTLVGMLGGLQSQHGLSVTHASISQKSNGLVSARITLDGGG
jgi:type II secretory pathway component PulM